MLALLGPLILWGFANRRRLYVSGGTAVVLSFAALSFVSALGFAAEGRDGVVAKRQTERLRIEAARRRLEGLEEARKLLGRTGRPAVIEAELAALRVDRRWMASKECAAPRGQELGAWCRRLSQHHVHLAAAKEAERLDGEIKAAAAELVDLREKSGHGVLDAQVAFIGEITGWPEAKLQVALALLAAFVMELGAGFGVTLGVAPLQARLRERREGELTKPAAGGHLTWGEGAPAQDEAEEEDTAATRSQDEATGAPAAAPKRRQRRLAGMNGETRKGAG